MNIGKCKLCLTDNVELLNESHIIPKFLHNGLKDVNGKYNLILPDKFVKDRRQHLKTPSGAMYESDLLCAKCDNETLASYENSLRAMLTENQNNNSCEDMYFDGNNIQIKIYKNIDYQKFKLGLLSILWRSSISNIDFFKEVNLDSENSENIRLMLYNNDAKNIEDYPMISYLLSEDDEQKLILNPRFINETKMQFCKFIVNGYMILFIIGKLKSSQNLYKFIPNDSGLLHLQIREKNYMRNYTNDIIIETKSKQNK